MAALTINSCRFYNGTQTEENGAGGIFLNIQKIQYSSNIAILNTILVENFGPVVYLTNNYTQSRAHFSIQVLLHAPILVIIAKGNTK